MNTNITKPIYVLSTGRTGSNFLADQLNSLSGTSLISHQAGNSRLTNIKGNMALSGHLSLKTVQRTLGVSQVSSYPVSTADPLKSMSLALYLKQQTQFRDYKLIHLLRDPRNFVTSFMNWKNRKLSGLVAHHLVPYWQPNPFLLNEVGFFNWMGMSKFEHFCWIWKYKNTYFQNAFGHQNNYLQVTLEALTSKDTTVHWKKLLEFLELPFPDDLVSRVEQSKVNPSNKKHFLNWRSWDHRQARILDKYCGDLMGKLGYGQEEEWLNILKNN